MPLGRRRTARRRLAAMVLLLAACGRSGAPPATPGPLPEPMPESAPRASLPPTADSVHASPPRRRLFKNQPFGTDAQFNPVAVALNHGFDQLRTSPRQDITTYPFGKSFGAVLRAVSRPDKPLRRYGYGNWLRNEVFPLSLRRSGGGQWYPNYTLHLFGGGVTYVRLEEWYTLHGIGHPRLAAGLTTYASHLLTEAMENGTTADRGVDALTDLLIFDAAAIALWNQTWTRRLFTGRVETMSWYGQLSVGVPDRTIENAYAMIAVRGGLSAASDWKVVVTHGYVFLVGVSRRVGSSYWVTAGAGADAPVNPVIDTLTGKKTAILERNAGLFFDRDGSLLASLVTRGGTDNGLTLNVYPGMFRVGPVRPSFWLQQNRAGGMRFGISSSLGIGLSGATHIPPPH